MIYWRVSIRSLFIGLEGYGLYRLRRNSVRREAGGTPPHKATNNINTASAAEGAFRVSFCKQCSFPQPVNPVHEDGEIDGALALEGISFISATSFSSMRMGPMIETNTRSCVHCSGRRSSLRNRHEIQEALPKANCIDLS
jgi:hypothetical protein